MLSDQIVWNTGFWGTLLGFFSDFISSFGWTIILFTIILKLIMSPLEFLQRRSGMLTAKSQEKMRPELDKIRAKYANDPDKMRIKLNEKQAEFMRNGDMKIGSTCLVMLVYMVITLVVFISFFYSIMGVANTQTVNTYIALENKYDTVMAQALEDGKTPEEAKELAQDEVLIYYNSGEVTESWLWVSNIWKPDTRTSVTSSFDEFKKVSSQVKQSPYTFEGAEALTSDKYDAVMAKVTSTTEGKWNGYYILIVLCGLVSFLSMQFSSGGFKKKAKSAGAVSTPGVGNFLKWILPIIMVLITLFYSVAFALYVFANSVFSLIATPIYNAILKKMANKKGSSGGSSPQDEVNVDYRINKITKLPN